MTGASEGRAERAERELLGALMLEGVPDEVQGLLDAEDFSHPHHAALYETMLRLQREGFPVNFLTLDEALGDAREEFGGVDGLIALANAVTSTSYMTQHAKMVAGAALLRRCIRFGEEMARAATEMPLGLNGEVRVFVKERERMMRDLLDDCRPPNNGAAFRSAEEIVRIVPPGWLVHGIIPRNALVELWGAPSAFKSFLVLAWAWAIAFGKKWLGRKVAHGSVIYIASEGVGGLPARMLALAEDGTLPSRLHFHTEPLNLLDEAKVDAFIADARTIEDLALVVADTLARCSADGDENTSDMGRVVAACDRIRRETGAAVLLVHHSTKDGKTSRGHSSLEGAADGTLEVRRDDRRIVLRHDKEPKDAPPIDPINLQVEVVEVEFPAGGRATSCRLRLAETEELTQSCADIAEALDRAGPDGATTKDLMDATGWSKNTVLRALKALSAEELPGNRYRSREAANEEAER